MLFSVTRLAVQVFVHDAAVVQVLTDNRQQAGELRKDQGLVAFLSQFFDLRAQHVQLGR